MAEFLIKDTFVLRSRKSFVLIGDVVSGEVDNGMILLLQNNSAGTILIIDSVEAVTGEAGLGLVGLLFKYEHENELDMLKDMKNQIVLIA
jgi:hypothetical protein